MAKKSHAATKKIKISSANYTKFITSLKTKIRSAQVNGAIAVNRELVKLYWEIGKDILEKQEREGWGSNVLEKVARDLQNEFPGVEGFSRRNMFRMRAFYHAYAKVPQAVAQLDNLPIFSIPWGHNALILEKVKNTAERLWYASKTIEHGWSRSMLTIWIENNLYRREGKAITNFKVVLPTPQSDLAQQTTKDSYVFDFFTLQGAYRKRSGRGVGQQYSEVLDRTGARICICWETIPNQGRRKRSVHRFAILSSKVEMLRSRRA